MAANVDTEYLHHRVRYVWLKRSRNLEIFAACEKEA